MADSIEDLKSRRAGSRRLGADLELGAITIGKPLEADRGTALRVCHRDRLTFAQATIEADREAPRGRIADRTTHAYHAVDVLEQGHRLCIAVAGAQDYQSDRGPRRRPSGLASRPRCAGNIASICAASDAAITWG